MLKTKYFRVAREGATVDGRSITAQQVDQMAANYNPARYGARIWLEHFRGLFPDSIFKALGDVLSLKADTDSEGKRVLMAEISPTSDLMEMNKQRQKVFTSIEMDPSFSDTNEAYMVGLAVTDTPASLGTEMLQFSRSNEKFAEKLGDHIYSDGLETVMELAGDEQDKPGLFSRVKELLGKKSASDDQRFSDINDSVLAIAESQQEVTEQLGKFGTDWDADKLQKFCNQVTELSTDLESLKGQLEETPPRHYRARPPASGGDGKQLADC